jgi:hypothetical protein
MVLKSFCRIAIERGRAQFSFTYFSGKHMKYLLMSAAVMTVFLSACGKEPAPPAPAPVQPTPQATPAPAPAPAQSPSEVTPAPVVAAPGAVMSDEEKMKIVNEAKKKANKGD